MNVLIDEYSENPKRNPAAPAYVEKINEEINENAKSQDARLFKNLGDNLAFQHSTEIFILCLILKYQITKRFC